MRLVLTHIFIFLFAWLIAQDSSVVNQPDTSMVQQLQVDSNEHLMNDSSVLSKYDSVILKALTFKGVHYRYGGTDANGFDCSGLICTSYKYVDVILPHSSSQLATMGESVLADDLQTGDLIFFKGRSNNSVGHVALVSKVIDGFVYIVHATTSRGVIEEVLQKNSYFMKRWLFNRRIA